MTETSIPVWPRLEPEQREAGFDRLLKADPESAADLVDLSVTHLRFYQTGSERVTRSTLEGLRAKVLDLAVDFGFPGERKTQANAQGRTFDQELALLFGTQVPMLQVEAAEFDVWAFLTLRVFPDVGIWRWPAHAAESFEDDEGRKRKPVHRLRDPRRNVFRQAWFRFDLLGSEACNVLDEDAFVQLTDRLTLLGDRSLGRLIVDVVLEARTEGALTRDQLRDAMKFIRQLCGRIAVDTLPKELRRNQLMSCIQRARRADPDAGASTPASTQDVSPPDLQWESPEGPQAMGGSRPAPQAVLAGSGSQETPSPDASAPAAVKVELRPVEADFLNRASEYREYLEPMLGATSFEEATELMRQANELVRHSEEPMKARRLYQNLGYLVDDWGAYTDEELSVIVAALRYFVAEDDAIADTEVGGLDDDEAVITAAFHACNMEPPA